MLDALNASAHIRRIVLIGLPPDTPLRSAKPITFLNDHSDLLANIQAGGLELLRQDPATQQFLIVASDVPCTTPAMLDWLVEKVEESAHDIYYFVVERKVMEARFPQSRRTYIRLKDVEVCGGDIHAARAPVLRGSNPLWQRIINARKNPLQQAMMLGLDTLLAIALHRLSLSGAERSISRKIGLDGQVVMCPYAELGMDVDKPFQYDMIREYLTR